MPIPFFVPAALLAVAALSACSPKFDWRDFRSSDAPYAVLFPGKPATHTRTVELAGQKAPMTMAATEIDGITFAVGSAELADAAKAELAMQAMKTAMVGNLGGTVAKEESRNGGVEIEVHGMANGRPMALHGRFVARGKQAYQIVVVGPEKAVDDEHVETFIRSFKTN